MKRLTKVVALVLGVAVGFSAFPNRCHADTYEERVETIVADVIVYRPAGVILTTVGTALFVVILPFSAIVGGTKDTAKTLVATPFNFTFRRPMGTDMRDYVD